MRKQTAFYVSLMTLGVVSCVGFGIQTRNSFADNTHLEAYLEHASQYPVSNMDGSQFVDIYFNNHVSNVSELENQSDLVVQVKPTSVRTEYLQAVLTKALVTHVYKSSSESNPKEIYIFEPSNFSNGWAYEVFGGYNLMQTGKEYLMFLKRLKVPKGYHYSKQQEDTYMPVSTEFGKYLVSPRTSGKVISETELNRGIRYSDIQDYDIITTNPHVFAKYAFLKDEIRKKL